MAKSRLLSICHYSPWDPQRDIFCVMPHAQHIHLSIIQKSCVSICCHQMLQNEIVTVELWCVCSPTLTKTSPVSLFSASFTQAWVFPAKGDPKCFLKIQTVLSVLW